MHRRRQPKVTPNTATLDFDDEARALWARLNLDEDDAKSRGAWNPTDAIYCHPTGRGKIFVGNQTAAENLTYLRSIGVTHVVNCTVGSSKIPNFHTGKLQYYIFPISHWSQYVNTTNASVIAFSSPLFAFIEEAISSGGNVLVHCLAGAHRAGTTGVACLIHYTGMDVSTAITTAKSLRPIIDPIGQLPEFLHRLYRAYQATGILRSRQLLVPSTESSSSSRATMEATTKSALAPSSVSLSSGRVASNISTLEAQKTDEAAGIAVDNEDETLESFLAARRRLRELEHRTSSHVGMTTAGNPSQHGGTGSGLSTMLGGGFTRLVSGGGGGGGLGVASGALQVRRGSKGSDDGNRGVAVVRRGSKAPGMR